MTYGEWKIKKAFHNLLQSRNAPMCTCEFCHIQFIPRPQVKTPRACKNCQHKRQRLNEREWKEANRHLSDKQYHQTRRHQRVKKLSKLAIYLSQCLCTGMEMINMGQGRPNLHQLISWILPLLQSMGIRRANKFWTQEMSTFYSQLDGYLQHCNLQTSLSTS